MEPFVRFATLASGSSGNCVYIRVGEDEILIDEGRSTKYTEEALARLGSSLERISAIFVTHEHSDHVAGLAVTAKKYGTPIYMTDGTLEALPGLLNVVTPMPHQYEMTVGALTIRSFPTPHDAAMSVGYVVEGGGHRFGVATDMGFLCKEGAGALYGCDAAVIESNYDPELLRTGPYPPALQARIASDRGHLPNDAGGLLAAVLAHGGAKKLMLGHLSAENNTPELAYRSAKEALDGRALSAELLVAERSVPTILI